MVLKILGNKRMKGSELHIYNNRSIYDHPIKNHNKIGQKDLDKSKDMMYA